MQPRCLTLWGRPDGRRSLIYLMPLACVRFIANLRRRPLPLDGSKLPQRVQVQLAGSEVNDYNKIGTKVFR